MTRSSVSTTLRGTLLALALTGTTSSFAVISFTGTEFSESFDGLGAGPSVGLDWTNNATLPGWYAYQSNLQGGEVLPGRADKQWGGVDDYERSIGQLTGGSLLNLGNAVTSTNRSLGSYSSNHDFVISLVLRNDSPVTYGSIDVSYFGEQWQVNANFLRESMVLDFSFGVFSSFNSGPSNPNTVVPNSSSDPAQFMNGFTDPAGAALDFAALQTGGTVLPLDGNAPANRQQLSATLPLLWEPHQFLVLRWFDDYTFGDTQAVLAINDLQMSATPIPEPSSTAVLLLALVLLAHRCRALRHSL